MIQPEKDSFRPRGGIEEVANVLEGAQIKAWGHWSEGGEIVSYIGWVSIIPTPMDSLLPIQKEEEEKERGKWEEFSAIIEFIIQDITDMGEVEALEK